MNRLLLICLSLLLSIGCAPPRVGTDPPLARHPLTRWHKVYRGGKPWRLTSIGVETKGGGIERTPGKPRTVTWIWETYYAPIDRWSNHYQVPAELIVATIATEAAPRSGAPGYTRDPASIRREKGFVSIRRTPQLLAVGLMQTTLATARAALAREGVSAREIDDQWLLNPDNAIRAGTAYLALQAAGKLCNIATMLDPPVVFAAYNAGGVYRMGGWSNRWKMRQYPHRTGAHVDRAIRFFNDSVAALRHHSLVPGFGFRDYVYQLPEWPRRVAWLDEEKIVI